MAKKVDELKKHLKKGHVYRRADLEQWSHSVDRHLHELVKSGFLEKLAGGLYYVPKRTVFGTVPPNDVELVRTFLKDDDFLLTSPNAYNSLGVGTTQLYNNQVVYNHKRHGEFVIGGKKFLFHAKHRFPQKLTEEFLLVDLVNNLDTIAEDKDLILNNIMIKASSMNMVRLKQSVLRYGNGMAKTLFAHLAS